ncbi:MAG: hypothetical protein ING16_17890 [Roseomonas sp.]|nr:hypothetical protein [Roseomonas sp.]
MTDTTAKVGCAPLLVAAGARRVQGRLLLRFVLMLEPKGQGGLALIEWPKAAQALAAALPRVEASRFVGGRAQQSTLLTANLRPGGPGVDVTTPLWRGIVGGTLQDWSGLASMLSAEQQPPPLRCAIRRDQVGDQAAGIGVAGLLAALEGRPPPMPSPRMPDAMLALAAGAGLPTESPEARALRQGAEFGAAALDRRRAFEVAVRQDPERALALLEEGAAHRVASLTVANAPAAPLANTPADPDPVALQRAIQAEYRSLCGDRPPGNSTEPVTQPVPAMQLWADLAAHPSLQRLFGLVREVEVDITSLVPDPDNRPSFWLFRPAQAARAEPLPPGTEPRIRTLARLAAGPEPSFWPCLMEEACAQEPKRLSLIGGFRNLGQRITENGMDMPRWRLMEDDGSGPVFAEAASGVEGGTRGSPGLALVDRRPSSDETACDCAIEAAAQDAMPIVDARPLITGWQLDVRIEGGGGARPWRSLSGRRIGYRRLPSQAPFDLNPLIDAAYAPAPRGARALAEAALIRQLPDVTERPEGELVLHGTTLVHWTGGGLGASTDGKANSIPDGGIMQASVHQLHVSTETDMPRGAAMPMVIGQAYSMRLRAVFRGGVTPSPDDAHREGQEIGPHRLRRVEPIAAPTVLHVESDLRQGAARQPRPDRPDAEWWLLPAALPGRPRLAAPRAREMVLMPSHLDVAGTANRRVLLPPTVSAAMADRHGMRWRFGADVAVPRDGLPGIDFAARDGGWPAMRAMGDATLAFDLPVAVPLGAEPLPTGDALLRARRPNTIRKLPFLPDPLARTWVIALARPGQDKPIPGSAIRLPVYPSGTAWPDPPPLLVQLQGRTDAAAPRLIRQPGSVALPELAAPGASQVNVRLEAGERLDLLAWCLPDSAAGFDTFDLLSLERPIGGALPDVPLPWLAGVARLSLAHAATRGDRIPAPVLREALTWKHNEAKPLSGRISAAGHRIDGLKVVAIGTALVSGTFDDPEKRGRTPRARTEPWPRNSLTGDLRTHKDVYGFDLDPQTGLARFPPEQVEILARYVVGEPPSEFELQDFACDLPVGIKDGKARRILLEPVAVPGGSNLALDRHGEPLDAEPSDAIGQRRALTIRATRRPSPPLDPWIVPAFDVVPEGGLAAGWTGQIRRSALRIRVARPWFSSGEGERLGVVVWPPHLPNLDPVAVELDEFPRAEPGAPFYRLQGLPALDLGPGGAFVTRWGADPIREAPDRAGLLLSWDSFAPALDAGWTLVRNTAMPLPRPNDVAPDAVADQLLVSLLVKEPRFDPDFEQWYVDLPLDVPRAAEPFVSLGLVRWQPEAEAGRNCSEPVRAHAQLLERRSLRWRVERGRDSEELAVEVRGLPRHAVERPDFGTVETVMHARLIHRRRLLDEGHVQDRSVEQPAGLTWDPVPPTVPAPGRPSLPAVPMIEPVWRTRFALAADDAGAGLLLSVAETPRLPSATVGLEHLETAPPLADLGPRYIAQVQINRQTS